MAVFGRFQVYYGKIKSELEIIREDYEYTNLSKAFAHWYLVNHVKVSEQEIEKQLQMEMVIMALMQSQSMGTL